MKFAEKSLLPLLIVLTIFLVVMTVVSYSTVPQQTDEVVKDSKEQSIVYNYRVYPKPSILYPEGTEPLPSGRESYFAAITDRIDFDVTAEIISTAGTSDADFEVRFFVRSDGQWQKTLSLVPDITKTVKEGGGIQFHTGFTLPLLEASELAESIIEETNVRPSDRYALVVQSTLSSQPFSSEEPPDFTSEYKFSLSQNLIVPNGEMLSNKDEHTIQKITTISNLYLLGYALKVSTGRVLFPSMLIFFLGGVSFCIFSLKKKSLIGLDKCEAELRKIKRKFGGRIFNVTSFKEFPDSYLKVQMSSFKDLVKIADERERPIFQSSITNLNIAQFYIVDDNIIYSYRLSKG